MLWDLLSGESGGRALERALPQSALVCSEKEARRHLAGALEGRSSEDTHTCTCTYTLCSGVTVPSLVKVQKVQWEAMLVVGLVLQAPCFCWPLSHPCLMMLGGSCRGRLWL